MSNEKYRRQQVLRPTAGIVGCHRDHCTPEEQEVVEAALAWYEQVDQLQKLSDAEVDLINATSKVRHRRLIAARAEEGK